MKHSLLILMVMGGAFVFAKQNNAPQPETKATPASLTAVAVSPPVTKWKITSRMSDASCIVDGDLNQTTTIELPADCDKLQPGLGGKITFRKNGHTGYTLFTANNQKITDFATSELDGYESVSSNAIHLVLEPEREANDS